MKAAALLCAAALVACASPTTPSTTARPATVILAPEMLLPRDGAGVVVLQREDSIGESACGSRVLVDGKPVAELGRNEEVAVHLAPGEHVLSTRTAGQLCPLRVAELTVVVRQGERRVYLVGISRGWVSTMRITAASP